MKSGKSSKSAKKLNLSRETIKKLSESDLEGVQGAQMKTSETGGNCYSLMIDGCG
ncbi:MAG TPA: class I lanthipeptide [Thermoanaerobaculia bacterium]|nr:class I lanthipeptide [Thermoanaerobaculia bacterium]